MKSFGLILGLLLLFVLGFGVRQNILKAQEKMIQGDVPYTLESAIAFRMVQQVYDEGSLPRHEPWVQSPEGVPVFKTYSIGSEYVHAALARMLPDSLSLTTRIRLISLVIFCLGIPLVALWAAWQFRSPWAGLFSGLFYAVALSAVVRSTGQEISRENFSFPFIIGFFALDAYISNRADSRVPLRWLLLQGLLLAVAVITWDMAQYVVGLYGAVQLVQFFTLAPEQRTGMGRNMAALLIPILLAGVLHPYLRSHGFLISVPMLLLYGPVLAAFPIIQAQAAKPWSKWIPLLPLAAGLLIQALWGSSYQHFGELLWAKLVHLNVKPADPSVLSFSQRIMWTPALNSATWGLTRGLFPATWILAPVAVLFLLLIERKRVDFRDRSLCFYWLVSVCAFILFVRFHVFAILFSSVLIGGFVSKCLIRRGTWAVLGVGIALAGLVVETKAVLSHPERWGRPNTYYRELDELTTWLRTHAKQQPVLANFGVSGSILTYGNCPIILHPKFETQAIRDRVEAYASALFKGDETGFRNWADTHGCVYYVFAMGEFARGQPELQLRYMVDALNPPTEAAARLFNDDPLNSRWFRLEWSNRKYRVFKMVRSQDEEVANEYADLAELALQHGDVAAAHKRAMQALAFDFKHAKATDLMIKATSLKEQGL